jgi:hypothetical protein
MYVPDPVVHPQPWHCFVGTVASGFKNFGPQEDVVMKFLAGAGYLCLFNRTRLISSLAPGQTTDGKWHQQTDDMKIAVRYMRSNPGGLGYAVTGKVITIGGSGSAHHALYMALDGTLGDDKADAAICMSPPTDFSDRQSDVSSNVINDVTLYGRTTDLTTLRSESPIALNLADASPILHFNGDHENMALSMLTLFENAMATAGAVDYTAILNTGTVGTLHSFAMFPYVQDAILAWAQARFPTS